MRSFVVAVVGSLLLSIPLASAEDDPSTEEGPAAFLAAAHGKQLDLTSGALESFSARLTLRRSDDVNLSRNKHLAAFGYGYSAPDREDFDMESTFAALQKPLKDGLAGLWRDIAGAMWFPELAAAAPGLALSPGDPLTELSGKLGEGPQVRAFFETETLRFSEFRIGPGDLRIAWSHRDTGIGYRVWRREVFLGEKRLLRTDYDRFRDVNGFTLPTILRLTTDRNRTVFAVEYEKLNGRPAKVETLDRKAVKEKVEEVEKGFKEWIAGLRIDKLWELSELDHDLASEAVAKLGLSDREPEVRAAAAEILGVMKRKNGLRPLLAALRQNEDQLDVYLRIVDALGELGDPRAVDALAGDWWHTDDAENALARTKAKIRALGNLRHAKSVDALIDLFTITSKERIAWVKADIVNALVKLTGQDFKGDHRAWTDWWKKNRARFRF